MNGRVKRCDRRRGRKIKIEWQTTNSKCVDEQIVWMRWALYCGEDECFARSSSSKNISICEVIFQFEHPNVPLNSKPKETMHARTTTTTTTSTTATHNNNKHENASLAIVGWMSEWQLNVFIIPPRQREWMKRKINEQSNDDDVEKKKTTNGEVNKY